MAEGTSHVVVISDIHGCSTLLREAVWPHLDSGAELCILGDLFDRSPEPDGDRQVLELVRDLQSNPEIYGLKAVTCLRGNHEAMLLNSLKEEAPGKATKLWMRNGGNPDFLPVAREHRDWLEALPYTAIRGQYLFVHAGVRPGVALEDQTIDDLLWIREPFLSQPHGLAYTLVHGHTFSEDFEVVNLPYRIGIDTAACWGGQLTALELSI